MNWPNRLTIIRIILTPVMILLFYLRFPWHYTAACAVFIIASLTDILDGAIARKQGIVTKLGKLLDPMADKLLVCSALIMLVDAGALHSLFALVLIGREFVISAFRMIAAADNIVLAADRLGKFKTLFQSIGVGFLMLSLQSFGDFNPSDSADPVSVVMWITGTIAIGIGTVFAVWSCINYMVKNRGVFADKQKEI